MAALLLDENMPRSAARALRDAGHDVAFVAEVEPAADDRRVLALARAQQRVLVSFDADFGDLIYRQAVPPPPAVIYLRLHPIDGTTAAALVMQALTEPFTGHFVVCTPDARRRRPFPADDGRA